MQNEERLQISQGVRLKLIFLAAAMSFSSIFQMGYSNAYVNTAIESFRLFLNQSLGNDKIVMTSSMYTWIWSVILNSWFPGFALGNWLAIPLTDKCGRKKGLLTGNMLTLLAVSLITLAVKFEVVMMLLLGRFLSALSSGISMCALILFLQEISSAEMRGQLSFFAEMAFVSMNALGVIMGMSSVLGNHLTYLVALALVPAIVSIVILLPLHETPKYLLLKRKDKTSATSAINFYLGTSGKTTEDFLTALQEDDMEECGENKTSVIRQIFTTPHIRFGLLLGILALQITTSIWPIIFFSTEFLRRANVSNELAEDLSSFMLLLSTVATFVGFLMIEKFGRRKLFIIASAFNITSLIAFVLFSQLRRVADVLKYLCVLAICCHGISYSFATGPIAWFITAELVPTQYRSTCQSIALSVNHMMAFALTLFVLPLYDLVDSFALLILLVIPTAIALFVLYLWLPETRARDIQQVISDLQTGNIGGGSRVESYEMSTKVFEKNIIS